MQSWFIRHTQRLGVADDDVRKLWDEDRIGIHIPGHGPADLESLDPQDYSRTGDKIAIGRLATLAQEGGLVWAQYRTHREVQVGFVEPGTPIEIKDATWKAALYGNRPAKLKTLQLRQVQTIGIGERMSLKATRPTQGTISPWPGAYDKLQNIVEGKTPGHAWENLSSTAQQEIVCSEFLRWHNSELLPRLKWLLLATGRTLKDVDIYGLATDGKKLLAQVTFLEKSETQEQKKRLAQYNDGATHLIIFCRCSEVAIEDHVIFVPVEGEVFAWLEANPAYSSACFSGG